MCCTPDDNPLKMFCQRMLSQNTTFLSFWYLNKWEYLLIPPMLSLGYYTQRSWHIIQVENTNVLTTLIGFIFIFIFNFRIWHKFWRFIFYCDFITCPNTKFLSMFLQHYLFEWYLKFQALADNRRGVYHSWVDGAFKTTASTRTFCRVCIKVYELCWMKLDLLLLRL